MGSKNWKMDLINLFIWGVLLGAGLIVGVILVKIIFWVLVVGVIVGVGSLGAILEEIFNR